MKFRRAKRVGSGSGQQIAISVRAAQSNVSPLFDAMKLSTKLDQSYSNTVGFLRRKLRIEFLKTVLMSVRGKTVNISDLDLNLLSYYVK